MSAGTRFADAAIRAGSRACAWASRLDVVREAGPGYALLRRREQAQEAELLGRALERFYVEAWGEAAADLGAEIDELEQGFLEVRRDGRATRVWRQLSALDEAVSLRFALDKTLVHHLLTERGIPVPAYTEFDRLDAGAALRFMADVGGNFVVKPADGGRGGAAVTGCVRSETDLARARLSAARLDRRLLIERQVPGDMYRLLYLDGELLDVVVRFAPRMRGDGRSTVLELIGRENQRRLGEGRPQSLMTVDLDCLLALRAAGKSPSSVLRDGETLQVKSASSENSREENHTVRKFSADVIEQCGEAVRAVGLRLAGVDLVTPDIDVPLDQSGGAIIEVNGTPGFQYHYQVADQAGATPVAIPILRRALEEATRGVISGPPASFAATP